MHQTRYFTLGDRLRSVVCYLYDSLGNPVSLNAGDTVAFRMVLISTGAVKVADAVMVIVSAGSATSPAIVRYDWLAADVDTAGRYCAWVIRTSGGLTEHYPAQDPDNPQFEIIIEART